jgi:carboxypeptidase Taq
MDVGLPGGCAARQPHIHLSCIATCNTTTRTAEGRIQLKERRFGFRIGAARTPVIPDRHFRSGCYNMQPKMDELKRLLGEIHDLHMAAAVLEWDQETLMPPGGAPARARQLATLTRLAHERSIDPSLGRLLDDLRPYEEGLPYEDDDAGLIRVARYDFERAIKVPPAFMAELVAHTSEVYQRWTVARPANDFHSLIPDLERTLDLSRQLAEFFPGYEHICDPLIEYSDRGMTVATLRPLFAELRQGLAPLVKEIGALPPADDRCLRQSFPEAAQLMFGRQVVERLGYDFRRGRQDESPHPFMTAFSIGDIRITTRVDEHMLSQALMGTIHEAGHAMYEQGIDPEYENTPLADGVSSGVHESQSRLWENIVGRSLPFWEFFYPQLQSVFPEQLEDVSLDVFYRAINRVKPSLIRTEADELTYNLHVMIRFELEVQMLEGRLAIRDLPEAWRERYRSDLGVVPPDDRDGALQDVHWYGGRIGGAFQGYTLGNVLGAQFFEAAQLAHPEIQDDVRRGSFRTLHGWLKDNIYQHGRKFTAPELVERSTGKPVSAEPYLGYLRRKFGELYQV